MLSNKKNKSYIKQQGRMHEDAALTKLGSDAINLNDIGKGNFYTFDLSSSTELTSVKSHISKSYVDNSGQLTKLGLQTYTRDFRSMIGKRNTGRIDKLSAIESDAKRMESLANEGFPLPSEINSKNHAQTLNYLRNETVLRVPDDHVQMVRDALAKDLKTFPENYHFLANPSEEDLRSMVNHRVQGTGLTAGETLQRLKNLPNESTQEHIAQADNGHLTTEKAITNEVTATGLPGSTGENKEEDYDYYLGISL